MKRQRQAQERSRVLADDELRALWRVAETNGQLGAVIRLALLTAQRRARIVGMQWSEISEQGEWSIPRAPREKGNGGVLVLPQVALDIIRAQARVGENPHVFPASRGPGSFRGMAKLKTKLDARLPDAMANWTLHDCRRTARSLMARAGVPSEHAERVMGHAIRGVEGVYDRHTYRDEKAEALRQLAALIKNIVEDSEGYNVLSLTRARHKS